MTPTASPPAFSAASARIAHQTDVPAAVHQPDIARASSVPISSAAARYSGRLPELEPQNTQIRFMLPILSLDFTTEGAQIGNGYLAKGFTRFGSYSKSTRPSR